MIRVLTLASGLIASSVCAATNSAEPPGILLAGPPQLYDDIQNLLSWNMDACSLPKGAVKLEYELYRRAVATDGAKVKSKAKIEKTLATSKLTLQDDDRYEAEIFLRWLDSTRTMIRISKAPNIDANPDSFQKGFICLIRRFDDQGYPAVPTMVAQ